MMIMLNGKEETFGGPMTISGLLEAKGLAPRGVVVEVNQTIIDRKDFPDIRLKDRDCVEILRFVGGG